MALTKSPLRRAASIGIVGFALATITGCGPQSTGNPAVADIAGYKAYAAGNLSEAVSDYTAALSADPKNTGAYLNLGIFAQLQNRNADADSAYRNALIIDPNNQPALYNLANLVGPTNPWEAIDLYSHLLGLAPNNATAHNNLGAVLKSVGQNQEGDAELAAAQALNAAGQR